VHVSTIAKAVPFQVDTVLLSGTIQRGKGHRVLVIQAMVGSVTPGEDASIHPLVNGVACEPSDELGNPTSATITCPSDATFGCNATGTWWLDLDAAEAAHPGAFIGKPLAIELIAGTHNADGIGVFADMSVRLEKKAVGDGCRYRRVACDDPDLGLKGGEHRGPRRALRAAP
jgi:hypothetical protein